jgi:integrase
MARNSTTTTWSYSAGERGETRVRVFERSDRPGIWVDYTDEDGKRCRRPLGTDDRELAKTTADENAARFRRETKRRPHELTLGGLIDIYEREVTPTKNSVTQAHDRRAMKLFVTLWGSDRKPSTLSRRDWDAYIAARRSGRLSPMGNKPVRDRVLEQDLNLLLAMLNWACMAGDGKGGYLLERNPLKGQKPPSEAAPRRPILTRAQYQRVRDAAAAHSSRLECFVALVWETGHRSASVRQLRWSDVDLERRRVHWRGDLDKVANDHFNPLTDEAVAILKRERTSEPRIGDSWIFPALRQRDAKSLASRPLSHHAVRNLWKRLAIVAELPTGERYGWHSLRRAFANRLRRAPIKDLQGLGGWKTAKTLLDVYLTHDEDAQREALESDRGVPITAPKEAKG